MVEWVEPCQRKLRFGVFGEAMQRDHPSHAMGTTEREIRWRLEGHWSARRGFDVRRVSLEEGCQRREPMADTAAG